MGVVVEDVEQAPFAVDDTGRTIGGITFGRNALIPIVEWGGRVLGLDLFEPWILARRLIKVPMQTEIALGHRKLPAGVFMLLPVVTYTALLDNPIVLAPARIPPRPRDKPGGVDMIVMSSSRSRS